MRASESDPFEADLHAEGPMPHESEISSTGHGELQQHREMREMMRVAAWEMPHLAQLSVPYKATSARSSPLLWRYTTYLGDVHPAARKVVVEFRVADLTTPQNAESPYNLDKAQTLKLKKLAGARYNPDSDVVRMSCDSFQTQAQNKRFLGESVLRLLTEAKDPTDMFEDVPLDLRHHKCKRRLKFPASWAVGEERKAQLEESRKTLLLEEGERAASGKIVDGTVAIEMARAERAKKEAEEELLGIKVPATKGRLPEVAKKGGR